MDETELEEGEACVFHEDDYTSIDPDVSLSYIDDKIQNVLGHFKKDFEGLVSVESLGARYGIYGSFLPTYRRSPVQSHSRSPSRIQNNMASHSPNSMTMEGGHPKSLAQASAPHSVRHGSAPSFVHKAPFEKDLCRQTSRTLSMHSLEERTPKSEVTDRKRLKVRIKVGSDTLSVKESTIYSGLGLDGSPSSFDASPMVSEGLSLVMPFEVDKSTAQILQMMTSFPLDGGYLLSPLPYDLIQLSERSKVLQGFHTQTSLKANQENSSIGKPKNNKTFSGDCGAKLLDKKGLSLQGKRYGEDIHLGFDLPFKESIIDAVSCEELISDALKLPLLFNADSTTGEFPIASMKEKGYSGKAKRGSSEPHLIDGILTDKPNGKENSEKNLVHNRGAVAPSETVNDSGKIGNNEGGLAEKTGSKSKKASKRELKGSQKQKSKKSISCEGGKNKLSSGDKKKRKKTEAHGFATRSDTMENALGPTCELKDRNCIETNNRACISRSRNSSIQKELCKSRDKYKDFFGDFNEQEADLLDSPDMSSRGLKDSQAVDKATLVLDIDADHANILMVKSKRKPDQEFSGSSKKSKRATAEDQGDEILGVGSGYDPATNTARKDQMTNSEFLSSRISNHNVGGDSPNARDKPTYPGDECLHGRKSDGSVVAPSKGKADNFQHPPNSTLSSDKLISDNEQFNKKKSSVSKTEGKEGGARDGKADKWRKSISHHSLDNIRSLQKDSSVFQPALAATLSASKVFDSVKATFNTQELKGLSVETNLGKLTSGNKIIEEKANVHDVVQMAKGSPGKYSDDDYKGGQARSNHVNSSKDTFSHGNDKVEISDFFDNPQDKKLGCEGKEGDGQFKDQEKCGSSAVKAEKDILCPNQEPSILKSKAHADYDEARSLKKFDAHKIPKNLVPTSEREKSQRLPRDGEKNETSNCPQLYQGNDMSTSSMGASTSGLLKELKPNKKTDSQSRTRHLMAKHSVSNGYRGNIQNTPSPLRRDASSEAARNAIKEARNLKHLADRLKKGNGSSESTEMYFEAALKFLHGASLVESAKTENARHADMVESMKIYSDTAELCEFCAREYEKSKDMAMAALAYKCMEVAYMRVICISHQSANRDRDELQAVLQIIHPGESPSSSASDIENLNNSAIGNKAPQFRSTDSQPSADLVVTARNRPNFNRLLSFAHNLNLAMEASRKSRTAFTAANVSMDKLDSKARINSIKRALDFNFHDIDGLLRLVRLAKEVTSR